jgi:hypothetical protein
MTEQDDMTCAELADVAAELALGVLTGRARARAVAHLEECDACREDVRQLMATGEQLLELLPPAEPPLGFETRVLARLGLSVPAAEPPAPAGSMPPAGPAAPARRTAPAIPAGPSGTRPPSRPGPLGRAGRVRRMLAAAAVVVAVIAAGLGGWRIGAGSSPARHAALPLTQASLLSATRQDVGDVFLYSGTPRWMYMSVDLGAGDERVTCQVISASGKVTAIGSFRLNDGYGAWGSSDPGNLGTVRGARLVSATGTVLAVASFSRW